MGNLKQRLIKPGTDFNYAEGVKVKATEAVYADQVVYVTGSAGPFLTASRADANLAGGAEGRMMVAKHDIPADGYGVVLPWKLVKDFDTSAAGAVGDPVYLSDTPGTARASNVTFTCPTGSRHVLIGRVTVDATAANGGAMMLAPSAPEENIAAGLVTRGTTAEARPVEQFVMTLSQANNDLTMPYPVIVTGISYVNGGTTAGTMEVKNGDTNVIGNTTSSGTTDGTARYAQKLHDAYTSVAKGAVLRCSRTDGDAADFAIITVIRA
jgi:hypothetical protein